MTDVDPTRVDLELEAVARAKDPFVRRIYGYTNHGNFPIDCPVITEVTPTLLQGGCERGLILPNTVKHVVSLYRWERYKAKHPLKSFLEVEMYDSADGEPDREQIVTLARWVNVCRSTGTTLVHCQAGLNRSALVVAAALMLEGWTAEFTIDFLREQRSPAVLCNPTFEAWLHAFNNTLEG